MPNQPARKSGKTRIGTVVCPMTGAVCDVFSVRLGNRHAEKLYYRGPGVGTIQCYGPDGQKWLSANLRPDGAQVPPVADPAPQPDQVNQPEPAATAEGDAMTRFIAALGAR